VAYRKPRPNIDEDIRPFWEGLKRHEFLLFRCKECGAWYWPVAYCRNHENEPFMGNMQWQPASGRGRIFTFNVHRWAFDPAFKEDVPYVYALIELDEGPMFGTNIVGCRPEDIRIGQPVEITFEDHPEEGFTLPKARLVSSRA
jgi:uncharacterized OB-fold protein